MIKTELELENHKYYYAINQCKNDQADPILFINGAFQCMNSWQKAVDHFKDNTTTIVADLPGWGEADFLSDDYDFDFLARAIFQILEKESINKINIVSTSYGTPIAVSFAKNFPSFVSNLVLSSPITEINATYLQNHKDMLTLIKEDNNNELASFLVKIGLLNAQEGEKGNVHKYKLIKQLFVRQLSSTSEENISKFIHNTQRIINHSSSSMDGVSHIRMLSFTGEHDKFTSSKKCLKTALLFSQGYFTTIKNADHLFLTEKPEATCKLLDTFFQNNVLDNVEGCTAIFSMQRESQPSKKVLKHYEPTTRQTPIRPLSMKTEFLPRPSMLPVSYGTP